jgi:hypothetical protein
MAHSSEGSAGIQTTARREAEEGPSTEETTTLIVSRIVKRDGNVFISVIGLGLFRQTLDFLEKRAL